MVDDEAAIGRLVELTFGGAASPFRVLHAADGAQALTAIRSTAVDLVLLDVVIPILDGLRASEALFELPDGRRPRVVMLTAHASPADRARARAAGADYLAKPFSRRGLLDCLDRVLADGRRVGGAPSRAKQRGTVGATVKVAAFPGRAPADGPPEDGVALLEEPAFGYARQVLPDASGSLSLAPEAHRRCAHHRGESAPVRDHRPHDISPDREPESPRSRRCYTPEGADDAALTRRSRFPAATGKMQLVSRTLTVAPSRECLGPCLWYRAPIPSPVETGCFLGAIL